MITIHRIGWELHGLTVSFWSMFLVFSIDKHGFWKFGSSKISMLYKLPLDPAFFLLLTLYFNFFVSGFEGSTMSVERTKLGIAQLHVWKSYHQRIKIHLAHRYRSYLEIISRLALKKYHLIINAIKPTPSPLSHLKKRATVRFANKFNENKWLCAISIDTNSNELIMKIITI